MSEYKPIVASNNCIDSDKYQREWQVKDIFQSKGDLELIKSRQPRPPSLVVRVANGKASVKPYPFRC
jgi:hypothetical protein